MSSIIFVGGFLRGFLLHLFPRISEEMSRDTSLSVYCSRHKLFVASW